MQQQQSKTRVCVVGAGAAGLCAARHLAADPDRFDFTVVERRRDIGGVWDYSERIGLDDDGLPVHTAMYRDLRTNLPIEIMTFPDYPEIGAFDRSCVTHRDVLEYLKNYARHFDIRRFIQFGTVVESVRPELVNGETRASGWSIRTRNTSSGETATASFDALMLCNGHYCQSYVPSVPGLDGFQGRVMHSKDYRRPEEFDQRTVVLLGASSSGLDIALELVPHAKTVYLSHNKEKIGKDQSLGFQEVSGIDRFSDGKFVLRDGSTLSADVLIFCTGYDYYYPFLDPSCGLSVDDNYVSPLYEHLINVNHPSMCIMGVPWMVIPFPIFHMQVQYFLSLLRGHSHLPDMKVMLDDAALKSSKKRHAHKLGDDQWAYNDRLAAHGGFEALPRYYEAGYKAWSRLKRNNPRDYKNFSLVVERDKRSVRIVGEKGVRV